MTLEELLAREEIRELRVAYSTGYDEMDEPKVRANFIDDIVCEYPAAFGGEYRGVEAVVQLFRDNWANATHPYDTVHFIGNHTIEMTGPDTARGQCMLLDWVMRQDDAPNRPRGGDDNPLLLIGRYEDEYVRHEGKWKFARIKLTTTWPHRVV
ncbi:MAG TPA: nuclear transport factor 2 family protein [Croceicoccus sp.]|nr:nuclear transport factor 2 family protein [Croceicoccus sp.]